MLSFKEKSAARAEEHQRQKSQVHKEEADRVKLISAYNSLTDKHLTGYFSSTRIRRHLQRAGLITRSGRIVPDKEYRHKLIQRAHQRHVRECLAQAIFHKVLEMERVHQIEIKRKLEEFARRERVYKLKVERSKRYEEDIIRILSPRPPTGARSIRKQHSGPEGEHSESSESPGSSRPNTAPGKMQRPVRLKPIHSNSTTATLRRSSPYRLLESSNENDQPFNCTMDKECRRRLTTVEASRGISPYCLPVINSFVTPVPPVTKRKERGVKVTPGSQHRGRRLRPTTASSGADVNEDLPVLRSSVHQSRVCVNMVYFGKTVHLSHDLIDMRDEVKVFQQHCGGENLCVYKGMIREGETFQFISRRHRGFPFSLTFFLNGLQVERLSSCCEFKHRKGSRLGGRHGHFGFSSVEGASPCYKCIIAMGLDKKPTPPPKRVKGDGVASPKDAPEMETERTGEDAVSHSECETSQPQDVETPVKEEIAAEEDKVRDDYEEDFEADDEGPAEDAEAREKKSPSPSGKTERPVKERDASETEDDENDDIKSRSGSSSSGSNGEESDAEASRDSGEDEKAEQPKEVIQEETAHPPGEEDEPNSKEVDATEAESAVPKDSDVQNSAGDSTEMDVSDTSIPSWNENKQSDDTSGDKEGEKTVDESKQEEEPERAKSVQEKLAEAILKESHCSSEPELSDTSTEEEEESTNKSPEQDNKDAVPQKSVTFSEQQQTLVEETICEEDVVGEAEVARDQEETSEPKEQIHETEEEPRENGDSTIDEKVNIGEEDEKTASEENRNTAENGKSEDTEDTGRHPVSEEELAEDDKASEPQEDAAAKTTDAEAKENEEKTAVEADMQPGKIGQGAKSSEEDDSSVSQANKKPDETAVPDTAEAQAMTARETIEIKAEPSEEGEALNCEEAPVTDTEKRQQGDSEDKAAASETEVTVENSSSSLEESGDTTVEKTADTNEENAKDESSKDDEDEEAVEASKDDDQQDNCDVGGEQMEKSVEIDDKLQERSEEESNEAEKHTNPDEITEGEHSEERERDDEDMPEEEDKTESKTEETIENEENISEWTKSDSNAEGEENEEQLDKTHTGEEEVANEEKADESEKTEKDEESECVKNENDEEEYEEKGTNEGEKISEANTTADEEKEDEAEKEEKDQNESEAEQSEAAKNKEDGESEENKVVTVEGEEISEIAEEPEESADAALDTDNVNISDENVVESEDVGDSEAAIVACGTKTAEEKLNNAMESEEIESNSEKEDIDAENGEISAGAENKTPDDEGEAQTDVETAGNTDNERRTEEPTEDESTEVKEASMESGDGAEKHEDNKVNLAPDTDVVESEEKEDGSTKIDSEKIKEDSKSDDTKDSEGTKEVENGNISDHENIEESNVTAVIVASLGDQEETPMDVDLDATGQGLDESPSLTDQQLQADENSAAADGKTGADTEEASKASEEGASVLLKPQSSQLTQNNEADDTEESVEVAKETPGALATEDSTDLVTTWVTTHQTSKFFETFVEPIEDLKEATSDAQESNSNKEAAQSAELPRSASPPKMVKMSESAEHEHTPTDVNESRDKTKEEAAALDLEGNHSEDGKPCEDDASKDTPQVEEETEVTDFIQEAESEQNDKESVSGQDMRSEGSLEEDTVQESLMQDNTAQTEVSKPEIISENPTEEKSSDNDLDSNEEQAAIEEMKDLPPSSKTEEHCENLRSPEGLKDTEITDLTASSSEDENQEESQHNKIQPKPSDASIDGDRRDAQLIQDITHTLSKERSTFSVDETLFGQSSYPLLTAASTESGH